MRPRFVWRCDRAAARLARRRVRRARELTPLVYDELHRICAGSLHGPRKRPGPSASRRRRSSTRPISGWSTRRVRVAEPGPFPCRVGPHHAPHPGRPRASTVSQKRGGDVEGRAGRGARRRQRAAPRFRGTGRCAGGSQSSTNARARVIELRFFGGLTVEETASVLKVGPIP